MGPNTPYHAIAFQGPDGIVIAFQGTALKFTPGSLNFYGQIDSAFQGSGPGVSLLNTYYSKAENFFSSVQQYAQDNGLPLHLTGHSLGGGIAQMLGNQHAGIDTVTFNAPGTKTYMLSQSIMNLVATNTNIRNYRMEGDVVSLLPGENTQVGEVITIATGNGNNDPNYPATWLDNHMCIIQDFARCNPASAPVSDLPAGAGGTTTASLYPEPVNLDTVATGTLDASHVLGTTRIVQRGFNIAVGFGLTWLDPSLATEYDFATGLGDPNFASVLLPTQADPYDLQALVNNLWVDEGALAPLTTVDFGTLGVSQFKVFDIDPSLLDSAPFIVGVTFTGDGEFTGTVTSIQPNITTVPEPSTLGMFGLGLLLIGLFAGLRRRLC